MCSHQHLTYSAGGFSRIPASTRALRAAQWNVRSPGSTEIFTHWCTSDRLLQTEHVSDPSLCIPPTGYGALEHFQDAMPSQARPWMRRVGDCYVGPHSCVSTFSNRGIPTARQHCHPTLYVYPLIYCSTQLKDDHDPTSCQILNKSANCLLPSLRLRSLFHLSGGDWVWDVCSLLTL
jgi:hypothetical protein